MTTPRPPRKRSPRKSRPMTPELASEIYAFAMSPAAAGMTLKDIGRRYNVNLGRVSEIKRGMRL